MLWLTFSNFSISVSSRFKRVMVSKQLFLQTWKFNISSLFLLSKIKNESLRRSGRIEIFPSSLFLGYDFSEKRSPFRRKFTFTIIIACDARMFWISLPALKTDNVKDHVLFLSNPEFEKSVVEMLIFYGESFEKASMLIWEFHCWCDIYTQIFVCTTIKVVLNAVFGFVSQLSVDIDDEHLHHRA